MNIRFSSSLFILLLVSINIKAQYTVRSLDWIANIKSLASGKEVSFKGDPDQLLKLSRILKDSAAAFEDGDKLAVEVKFTRTSIVVDDTLSKSK